MMNQANKKHFWFSMIKSVTRVVGYAFLIMSIIDLNLLIVSGMALVLAESFGVMEEF